MNFIYDGVTVTKGTGDCFSHKMTNEDKEDEMRPSLWGVGICVSVDRILQP